MNLQPHRHSSCHRHPNTLVTGFCTSCLTERLAGIDGTTRQEIPSGSSVPDLRRTKSYSGFKRDGAVPFAEARRKSCDVRARNTLWDLFSVDDRSTGWNGVCEVETRDAGIELKEEDDDENEDEVRVSEEVILPVADVTGPNVDAAEEKGEFKTMKEYIDLEFQTRKQKSRDFRDIAGTLWDAAKKLGIYRRKHKTKKCSGSAGAGTGAGTSMAVGAHRPNVTMSWETQSEVGDYGFGRRSCDTDPRLSAGRMSFDATQMSLDAGRVSLDARRMSLDGPQYLIEELPRASWDGYLMGRSHKRLLPMVSVVEDVKAVNGVEDEALIGEKMNMKFEEMNPGGTALTKDYYSERRRRSFDNSSLNRRAVALEFDEVRSISNAKVSPETVGLFHGAKLLITEKEVRNSTTNSLQNCQLGNAESDSRDADFVASGLGKKGFEKLHRRRNMWNIWGLIQKRTEIKCGNEERYTESAVTDAPKRVPNGEESGAVDENYIRSYARNFCKMAGSLHSMSVIDTMGSGKKRRDDLILQRDRSARCSPNYVENGLLRFYLTPLRSNGRKSGKGKVKHSRFVVDNIL